MKENGCQVGKIERTPTENQSKELKLSVHQQAIDLNRLWLVAFTFFNQYGWLLQVNDSQTGSLPAPVRYLSGR